MSSADDDNYNNHNKASIAQRYTITCGVRSTSLLEKAKLDTSIEGASASTTPEDLARAVCHAVGNAFLTAAAPFSNMDVEIMGRGPASTSAVHAVSQQLSKAVDDAAGGGGESSSPQGATKSSSSSSRRRRHAALEVMARAEAAARYIPAQYTPLLHALSPGPPQALFTLARSSSTTPSPSDSPPSVVLSKVLATTRIGTPLVGIRNHIRTWEELEKGLRSTMETHIANTFLDAVGGGDGGDESHSGTTPQHQQALRDSNVRVLSPQEHLGQGPDLLTATMSHMQGIISKRAPAISRGVLHAPMQPIVGHSATSTINLIPQPPNPSSTSPSPSDGVPMPIRTAPTVKYQGRLRALEALVAQLQHATDYTKEVTLQSLVRLAEAVV